MAVREDFKKSEITGLEKLSKSELDEKFINEVITYRTDLSTSSEEDREQVTEEYMKRTKSLKEEINRRDRLYLLYYNNHI